jgi:hypothetical protein
MELIKTKEEEFYMKLSERAIAVSLKIKKLGLTKSDKKGTDLVADQFQVPVKAGKYVKRLFRDSSEVNAVNRAVNELSRHHRENTVPWSNDRLVPTANFQEYSSEMRTLTENVNQAVDEFVRVYERLLEEDRKELKGLFKATDYPTPDKIRDKFKVIMSISPVADTGDFRCELLDSEVSDIQATMQETHDRQMQEMTADLWRRLYEPVKKMADTLTNPEKVMRDATIRAAAEIAGVLKKLNITDDPEFSQCVQEVEQKLGVNPDDIRGNFQKRIKTAQDAQELVDKMEQYAGILH